MPDDLASRHGKSVPGHRNLQYWGKQGFIRVYIQVPRELRDVIGQSVFRKALGTSCISEAVRRSHAVIAEFQQIIENARAETPVPVTIPALPISREDIVYLALAEDDGIQREDMLRRINNAHRERVVTMTASQAAERSRRMAEQPQADEVGDERPQVPNSVTPTTAPPGAPVGYDYEAALQDWIDDHGSEPPAPSSVRVYRSHLARFFSHLGHTDMRRVADDDVIAWPQVLVKGGDGRKAVSNKSVNNHMASIRAIFRVAKRLKKITTDPTMGVVRKLQISEGVRKGFSREQHGQIIQAALRLESDDPVRWLWLIGCLTGARIGELADAKVSAVQHQFGHHVFNINRSYRCLWNGKPLALKTRGSSPRVLPLHSAIIDAGFLDYVARIREAHGADAALFPMLSRDQDGKRSSQASRLCLVWLRETVGIDDPTLVFHSTRHAIKTYLRGRVPEDVHDKITGHSSGTIGRSYGETDIAVMANALETHIKVVGLTSRTM